MKKLSFINPIFVFLLLAAFVFTSCSKHDSNDDNGGGSTVPPTGSWRVSMYWDTGDETNKFSGYIFNFATGGVVTATNGSSTATGTWSQTSTKFIINFTGPVPFDDLSDDWLIVEKNATSIKLKEDNPAQDDRLEFTRQ